jgi:hypothetical protein
MDDCADKTALLARCRLKDAKRWFAIRGWEVLPQDERGRRILSWGADHAWLAASRNPQTSVRNWCRKWAPWLTVTELDEIVECTRLSNKRWSNDRSAAVLEISVTDRTKHKLWHHGANDDPSYDRRRRDQLDKSAARSRKYRAHKSTGRPRGRPKLEGPPAWKIAGFKSERTNYRHKARGTVAAQSGSGPDGPYAFVVGDDPLDLVDHFFSYQPLMRGHTAPTAPAPSSTW